MQIMHEVASNVAGHDGILINATKAAELGVGEGDWIEVSSPVGTAHGQARLRQGIREDVIVMVGQFGHWKMPFAKDLKVPSVNDLVPMHLDLLDGHGSSIDATKVSVRKAEGQS